jgi:hypothetical protein
MENLLGRKRTVLGDLEGDVETDYESPFASKVKKIDPVQLKVNLLERFSKVPISIDQFLKAQPWWETNFTDDQVNALSAIFEEARLPSNTWERLFQTIQLDPSRYIEFLAETDRPIEQLGLLVQAILPEFHEGHEQPIHEESVESDLQSVLDAFIAGIPFEVIMSNTKPRSVKFVEEFTYEMFRSDSPISDLIQISFNKAASNFPGIKMSGGRPKRISIAFIPLLDCFYDRLLTGYDVGKSNYALDIQEQSQFSVVYEGQYGRIPYTKAKGQAVTFSFTGSGIGDVFRLFYVGSNGTTVAATVQLPATQVEVIVHLEYPRVGNSSSIKKRLTEKQTPQLVQVTNMAAYRKKKRTKRYTRKAKSYRRKHK